MNNNKKVLILILSATIIQLVLSLNTGLITPYFPSYNNVNLLSDILIKNKNIEGFKQNDSKKINLVIADKSPIFSFEDYVKKGTIINFEQDSLRPSLQKLSDKLVLLSENKKVKIRIAWFGDSQIEGDFITQDIRKLLQNYFGKNKGVGFVPITSVSSEFRTTAQLNVVGNVWANNFKKNTGNSNLFLSGYSFFGNTIGIDFKDKIKRDEKQLTEKWLLYGKGDSISIGYNDSVYKKYPANAYFNRILINKSSSKGVKFKIIPNKTPVYGMSSEPESGIVLDNFSFRGITGVELKKLNTNLLSNLNQSGYYDLIVLQYGVNMLFKPNDTNYDYYYKVMNPVVKKLKESLNKSDFLLFSCSDRAFNYNGEWKTAVGIDSLIHTQARIAYENKVPFYNFYQSIGGNGTIVKWADSTVAYANKDYIHFNFRGSKAVATTIFNAIINDYKKALKKKAIAKKKIISKKNTQV